MRRAAATECVRLIQAGPKYLSRYFRRAFAIGQEGIVTHHTGGPDLCEPGTIAHRRSSRNRPHLTSRFCSRVMRESGVVSCLVRLLAGRGDSQALIVNKRFIVLVGRLVGFWTLLNQRKGRIPTKEARRSRAAYWPLGTVIVNSYLTDAKIHRGSNSRCAILTIASWGLNGLRPSEQSSSISFFLSSLNADQYTA